MQTNGRKAFTLIELLAVMAIMILVAGIGIGGYFGMTRGAAIRSAVLNLKSTLSLARQAALTRGKRTYVLFESDGYYVCQKGGVSTHDVGSGQFMADEFANWDGVFEVGSIIFRLDSGNYRSSVVTNIWAPDENPANPYWHLKTVDSIWTGLPGDTYGYEINSKTYLPRGFSFGSGTPSVPPTVIFNGDGTTDRPTGDYEIGIYEDIKPGYVVDVIVNGLTGLVSEDWP